MKPILTLAGALDLGQMSSADKQQSRRHVNTLQTSLNGTELSLNMYEREKKNKIKSLHMFHRYSRRSDLQLCIHCDSPNVASGTLISDLICFQRLK